MIRLISERLTLMRFDGSSTFSRLSSLIVSSPIKIGQAHASRTLICRRGRAFV
jgi:hypothetical protein